MKIISLSNKEYNDFRKHVASEAYDAFAFIGMNKNQAVSFTCGGKWESIVDQVGAIELVKNYIILCRAEEDLLL